MVTEFIMTCLTRQMLRGMAVCWFTDLYRQLWCLIWPAKSMENNRKEWKMSSASDSRFERVILSNKLWFIPYPRILQSWILNITYSKIGLFIKKKFEKMSDLRAMMKVTANLKTMMCLQIKKSVQSHATRVSSIM